MWYSEGKTDRDHDYEAAAEREETIEAIAQQILEEATFDEKIGALKESEIPDELFEFVYRALPFLKKTGVSQINHLATVVGRWVDETIFNEAKRQAAYIVDAGKADEWFKWKAG